MVTSSNAAMLPSVTSDFSLCCLNCGFSTHYHLSTDSFSCIDLSFCSSSVVLDFTWSRLSSFCGSDHFLSKIFDEHLTWVSHLKSLPQTFQSPVDLLRHLFHTSCGADRLFYFDFISSLFVLNWITVLMFIILLPIVPSAF